MAVKDSSNQSISQPTNPLTHQSSGEGLNVLFGHRVGEKARIIRGRIRIIAGFMIYPESVGRPACPYMSGVGCGNPKFIRVLPGSNLTLYGLLHFRCPRASAGFRGFRICRLLASNARSPNAVFPENTRILWRFWRFLASVGFRALPAFLYMSGGWLRKPKVQTRYTPKIFEFQGGYSTSILCLRPRPSGVSVYVGYGDPKLQTHYSPIILGFYGSLGAFKRPWGPRGIPCLTRKLRYVESPAE